MALILLCVPNSLDLGVALLTVKEKSIHSRNDGGILVNDGQQVDPKSKNPTLMAGGRDDGELGHPRGLGPRRALLVIIVWKTLNF